MANLAKIHSNLYRHIHTRELALAGVDERIPVIIHYRDHDRRQALALAADATPATRHFEIIPASAHSATPAEIDSMSEHDDVVMIWHDAPVHTLLDKSVLLIGVRTVWKKGLTGKGIAVAVVDTGIDLEHPDLSGRVIASKSFTGEKNGIRDGCGHGTHCAGIVGGSGAKYRGVAPECSFLIAKVLDRDGSGSTSWVMAGLEWAVKQGAQIINLSLGSDDNNDGTDALSVTCNAAVDRGVVVCVAAGNAGPDSHTVGSPACAEKPICIGATTKADGICDFSSRGPTADGRIKPDVCFPGSAIISCRAHGTEMGTPINQMYTSASGTSMATPHAAGACALLLQANPRLTPAEMKEILRSTAKNLRLPATTQGHGRARVDKAYAKAVPAKRGKLELAIDAVRSLMREDNSDDDF